MINLALCLISLFVSLLRLKPHFKCTVFPMWQFDYGPCVSFFNGFNLVVHGLFPCFSHFQLPTRPFHYKYHSVHENSEVHYCYYLMTYSVHNFVRYFPCLIFLCSDCMAPCIHARSCWFLLALIATLFSTFIRPIFLPK